MVQQESDNESLPHRSSIAQETLSVHANRVSFISSQRWDLLVLLPLLLVLAGWLRWRYIQDISLYVDEFTTIWAAKWVQELGIPQMPSGVLYTRGLLSSYVEAAFLALWGDSYTVARLPSLLFGLATIVTIFWIGQRLWYQKNNGFLHVGWLAAVGLAFLPEAIIWSGRARFYAQLQWLILLMVWVAFVYIVEYRQSSGTRWSGRSTSSPYGFKYSPLLFVLLFTLALYSQEQTLLLYPSIALAMLWWRGWHWLFQPMSIIVHLLCLVAMGIRYLIEIWGQPGYFETIQQNRPYVGFAIDIPGAWITYGSLFVAPARLPWTILGMIALLAALWQLRQKKWQIHHIRPFHQATLFFALQLGWVLIVVFTVVGTTWRDARYLFFVQPFWLLLGAAGALWIVGRMRDEGGRVKREVVVGLVLSGLIIGSFWPGASETLTQQVEGYDQALAFLAQVREPDDVVLSPQPPACALVLGECDYYALQQGYEEYVILAGQPEGHQWIDRWSGATLLNGAEQLAQVIQGAPRTWFVTDSLRLATRYDAAFVQRVVSQFEIAFEERGVLVLRADGWQASPAMITEKWLTTPLSLGPLVLDEWSHSNIEPGEPLHIKLLWRGGGEPVGSQFNTTVQLRSANGSQIGQADGPPTQGMIPTTLFFDTPLPDWKVINLPTDLSAGYYRLEVGTYNVDSLALAAPLRPIIWFRVGEPPQKTDQILGTVWENQLRLVGMDALDGSIVAGEPLNIRLVWRADAPIPEDYTIFLHLLDGVGEIVAQQDRAPLGGFYPTSQWAVEEPVEDHYQLILPEADNVDTYRLLVGLYQPESGVRLPLLNGQDIVEISKLKPNKQ